jgi:hypothetical protein
LNLINLSAFQRNPTPVICIALHMRIENEPPSSVRFFPALHQIAHPTGKPRVPEKFGLGFQKF